MNEDERFPGCAIHSSCILLFGHDGGCVGRRSSEQEELARLRDDNEKLRNALVEARDCIVSWAAYASPYFQEKWDLAGDLAFIDTVLRTGP